MVGQTQGQEEPDVMRTLPIIRAAAFALAVTAAATACTGNGGTPGAARPTSSQSSPEETTAMTSSPSEEGIQITIEVDGRSVRGVLDDNAPARALAAQFPLTLTFRDHGGQEKIASLPTPLPLDGMPAGSDADPLTIGYYSPEQALVLYYEHVGHFNGIVPIGTFDDLAAVRDQADGFSATLDAER